jgi:hypothetical protein
LASVVAPAAVARAAIINSTTVASSANDAASATARAAAARAAAARATTATAADPGSLDGTNTSRDIALIGTKLGRAESFRAGSGLITVFCWVPLEVEAPTEIRVDDVAGLRIDALGCELSFGKSG